MAQSGLGRALVDPNYAAGRRDAQKADPGDRAILEELVSRAEELGRDVPDHHCEMTDHEPAFWDMVRAARRHLQG